MIYTIGHSNLPLETFLGALTAYRIEYVADVRSCPRSRFPRFNRGSLERSLGEAGIGYRFFGEILGGRPDDPTCYRGGVLPARKEDVFAQIDYAVVASRSSYRAGIDDLLNLADVHLVAIMCSEGDPARCHRHHLIAQTLLDRVHVSHILVDRGGATSAVPAEREPSQQTLV
jgi:uncharacterized protein (DUF488 family)